MANGDRQKGWFRTVLEAVAVSAAVVTAFVGWRQWEENQDLKADIVRNQKDIATVEKKLQIADETIAEQNKRLKLSLDTFGGDYKVKVREAAEALADFQRFDTPSNRMELKERFDGEKAKRLETVRRKIQALIVFVKEWRPLLEVIRSMVNGEFDALEIVIAKGDEQAMIRQFGVIQENADSKIRLLNIALDAASKSKR